MVGTTDTPYSGDLATPRTTSRDAQYLIDTANQHFVAVGGALRVEDIVSTWAGIRPLAIGTRDDVHGTYKTSREHVVESDPRGMVMVTGGKLTTYRLMAAEAIDAACQLLPSDRLEGILPSMTDRLPLPGARHLPRAKEPLDALIAQLVQQRDCTATLAEHLVLAYGCEATDILGYCRELDEGFDRILPPLPVTWGEVRWVFDNEMPLDLVDLAVRRLPLYYCAGGRLEEALDSLAERMQRWAGLSDARIKAQVQDLKDHIETHRVTTEEENG